MFFRLYTHPFNIFYASNITFHSGMHTVAPLTLSADLLAWFACLSTDVISRHRYRNILPEEGLCRLYYV